MTDLTTTQKIRIGLEASLEKAAKKFEEKPTVENLRLLNWLISKLDFYNSDHYPEYKRQNQE